MILYCLCHYTYDYYEFEEVIAVHHDKTELEIIYSIREDQGEAPLFSIKERIDAKNDKCEPPPHYCILEYNTQTLKWIESS